MALPRPPYTVARLAAIDIAVHWRWAPVVFLGTALLAYSVLPTRFPTWESSVTWLVSAVAVLACELGLLLHELSHAVIAQRRGHQVQRIVFHGLVAETILGGEPAHDLAAALSGPAANLAIAGGFLALRAVLGSQGPTDVLLLLLVSGNLAIAAISLQPFGDSDGARALRAWRSTRD